MAEEQKWRMSLHSTPPFYVLILELCEFINYSKNKCNFNIVYMINKNQMLLSHFCCYCLLLFTSYHILQSLKSNRFERAYRVVMKSTDCTAPNCLDLNPGSASYDLYDLEPVS